MKPILFSDMRAGEVDGFVLALELVATTVVFGALGWLADRALGTGPFLMLGLGAFTLAYEVWKIVRNYDAALAHHSERRTPLRQGPR